MPKERQRNRVTARTLVRHLPWAVPVLFTAAWAGHYAAETVGPIKALVDRPSFDSLSQKISPPERTLNLADKPITDIIAVGDSMCYPNGEKNPSKPPTEHTGSFVHLLAEKLSTQTHPITPHNFATPGDATVEVYKTLTSENVSKKMLDAENPLLVVSMSGNDYRTFINNQGVAESLQGLHTAVYNGRLRDRMKLPITAYRLSRRHINTGKKFRVDYLNVLQCVDQLNEQRKARGKNQIAGLVITLPPDFGDAPAISFVPVEGADSSVQAGTFVLDNPFLKNIGSLVANTLAFRIVQAYQKFKKYRQGTYPVALLPMWEVVKPEHFTAGDQHTGPDGQEAMSIALEHAIFGSHQTPMRRGNVA